MITNITKENFDKEVLLAEGPVLVDFWASWCMPCKMLSPIVDELAQEYEGKWLIAKVNVDECSDVPMRYGIRNIPTLLFFKGGEMKDKMVGSTTKGVIVQKMASIE